jgi:hypothetical protein
MAAPVLQFKRGLLANLPGLRAGEPGFTTDSYDLYVGIDSSVNTNKFFGSHRYWTKGTASTGSGVNLVEGTSNGTSYITLKSPDSLAGIVTYTFPGAQGTVSSVLTNDGSGNLTWSSGSANPVFSGIATFTDGTDNTLGDANTGAVQIDGGLGINKNVTIGAGLSVTGQSHFIGTATFYGGQINLGDSDTDDIVVAGEFKSNLIPSDDATYNIGSGSKRWNNASFAGIGTFATGAVIDSIQIGISDSNTINTSSGKLTLHSAIGTVEVAQHLDVIGDLGVTGNVYIGGTTVTLRGTEVFIENKDIVLGYTTTSTPNDTTANHAGVAIASTEGTPLVSFTASGINTLSDTYKQMMWFKSGTLGFSTDAFAFNYGLAVGTTNMANGVRLAVGSGVTVSDTSVSATTFYGSVVGNVSSADQVKTVTASNTNANYYVTFVDANNGSATNESVYTDDGIYYNPGTNTFTTQHGYFTGNVTVDGSITGTATTATRATLIDITGTSDNATYYATFVDTSGGQTSETLRTGTALSLNASTGNVKSAGDLIAGSGYLASANGTRAMYMYDTSGDVAFQGKVVANSYRSSTNASDTLTFSDLDATFARNLYVTGIATVNSNLVVGGDVRINGNDIQASDGNTNITLTSNTLTTFAGDIKVGGNDIQASDGNTNITMTSNTLTEVKGELQVTGNIIKSSTGATAITLAANDVTVADDLTVQGNLYVNGSTTQVNTTAITVEDRTIELGRVDGLTPTSSTTWDLGVLFNYNASGAKKSAVVWEHSATRFQFASVLGSDTDGTDVNTPQLSVTTFAPIEIGSLWVTDCAGTSQVISCTGTERFLENITIDAGQF